MFWGFFVMVIIVKEGEWKKKNPPLRSGVQNYVFPSNLSLIEMTKISNTPKPTLLGQNSLVHEVRNKQWALNSLKITTNHSLPSTIFFFFTYFCFSTGKRQSCFLHHLWGTLPEPGLLARKRGKYFSEHLGGVRRKASV